MNKFILPILLIIASLFGSGCKPVESDRDFAEYTDCVVYAYDSRNSTGIATDFAKYKVTGNVVSGYFSLDLTDIKLTPSSNVRWAKVNGLVQYLQQTTNEQGEVTDVRYACFNKEGDTFADGDMTVSDLRFGWLTTIFWASFKSENGNVRVWSLPRVVEMYGNRNLITNANNEELIENSLSPRYDMEFNVHNSTVTFRTSGVTYPVDAGDYRQSFRMREMVWDALPVAYDDKGISINIDKFEAVYTDGERGKYEITNFRGRFDADYDGEHKCAFDIKNVATGVKIHVETTFDYYRGYKAK